MLLTCTIVQCHPSYKSVRCQLCCKSVCCFPRHCSNTFHNTLTTMCSRLNACSTKQALLKSSTLQSGIPFQHIHIRASVSTAPSTHAGARFSPKAPEHLQLCAAVWNTLNPFRFEACAVRFHFLRPKLRFAFCNLLAFPGS
jgi:hypothetical protein